MNGPKCHARRTNGEPCSLPAMRGQNVCHKHGGKAPQNLAAAQRRLQEQAATKLLADRKVWQEDAAPTTNPVEELMALSGRLREAVSTLGARLEMTEPCVCCGYGAEMDSVNVMAFNRAITASSKILTDLARLGLEERRVKVEEWQADLLLTALMTTLPKVLPNLTEAQEIEFRDTLLIQMRELATTRPKALG